MARAKEYGFTLLETLAAFSILAIGLGVFYSTFSRSMERQGAANEELLALQLAENNLTLVGQGIPLANRQTEGMEGDFAWSVIITPKPDPKSELGLYEVTSVVSWETDGKPGQLSLKTLKLGPREDNNG